MSESRPRLRLISTESESECPCPQTGAACCRGGEALCVAGTCTPVDDDGPDAA